MRSLILDKSPIGMPSSTEWKDENKIDNFDAHAGEIKTDEKIKSPSNQRPNSGSTPKNLNNMEKDQKDSGAKESALNNIGTKIASYFSKNSHMGSIPAENNTPKNTQDNIETNSKGLRDLNKRTIIQTYLECQTCGEKITSVRDLQILYLEYSFSEFLRHFFINNFSENLDWNELEKDFDKSDCPHRLKCRVFKLDEFLVKFYCGPNKLYSIKNLSLIDEKNIESELKAIDEKICIEKAMELKEKITVLMKFLKSQITEKKAAIRKPRLRSSILNTQSFNPDNLLSPLKKKDLILLINELNGIYKSLDMYYNDLISKLAKCNNYIEVERNRVRCFYFFIGILQKLNYIDDCLPKEIKEEESTRFTLDNLKRIFTFRQEGFSPSESNNQSGNSVEKRKLMKINLSEELVTSLQDQVVLKTDSFCISNKPTSLLKFARASKNNKAIGTFIAIDPFLNKRIARAKSCPNIIFEHHKFPLFLSEDEIKIPNKMLFSLMKENRQSFNKENKKSSVFALKLDGNVKTMSEEPRNLTSMRKPKVLNDSFEVKQKLYIPLENNESEQKETPTENDEVLSVKENFENEVHQPNEKIDTNESQKSNEDNKTDNDNSDSEEVFKHFNPNNLLKAKKFRKNSSTSMNDTPEWLILMDLMKGICDWEPENEFKSTKFYKFIPIIKSQPLSVIAYALNSMKYFKEVYIKEGFYEQLKFLKTQTDQTIITEHLTNFIKIKLYYNECVEKNDEFTIQTNILEVKKERFGYRNSYHNLEKLQQDEEAKVKFRKNTAHVSSFDEVEEILSLLAPSNKIKILIYYPRQFEALRMSQNISLGDFIKSLALSNPWSDNTGGKSNASFIKTYNNLYVFKNLRNNEFKMFKSYAIKFFKYMFKVGFEKKKKSFLAKIYGMFEVHIDSERYYYVAMENLFFGFDQNALLKIYDLKGSETNRYIPNSKANQVLFDTNFKIDQNGEPLSLVNNDKNYLSEAIDNDTKFLSKHNLIDYSLLLIIDRKNGKIKLGIIDYLRLFTWDKQVESLGKKMIKAGATPTIINAADYRKRFQESMNKYFMGIPH